MEIHTRSAEDAITAVVHTRRACRQTVRVSIIKGTVFVALIDDIFCGAAMAKGHDVLTVGRLRNTITKQIITASKTAGAACRETLISLMLQIVWLVHLPRTCAGL